MVFWSLSKPHRLDEAILKFHTVFTQFGSFINHTALQLYGIGQQI